MVRVASELGQYNLNLKVVDVVGSLDRNRMPSNVKIVDVLSHDEYLSALHDAEGFFLEYMPVQDRELGFYGDSLKFRDYWNTDKPILVSGPKMNWAPNPQTPEFGVFMLEDFLVAEKLSFDQPFNRHPYTWKDACLRILGSNQIRNIKNEYIHSYLEERD